jgi:hypothetical protein
MTADDLLSSAVWRKSTYSGVEGNCVEVGRLTDGRVAVRDTKDRSKAPHIYTAAEWDAFLLGAKAGEFDLQPPNS